MVQARFLQRPERFDRVDRVKEAVGEPVLPGDDRIWILGDPLVVEVDGRDRIEVPVGFTTDGASVPALARWLTGWGSWDEPQRSAAIVHDWLYTQRGVPKAYGDDVFEALLAAGGTSWLKRKAMYLAVKLGGGAAYRRDQAEGPHIHRK
jgi:hypothetical protein